MGRAETAYRLGLRIIGFANTTFLFFIYGDRYLLDSKGGYAWSPDHYEEHGNTTFEFEWMIIATYFMLGSTSTSTGQLTSSTSSSLGNCAHALSMTVSALNDYEREWGHVMPYGDVPLLVTIAGVLYYLKSKYQATLKL